MFAPAAHHETSNVLQEDQRDLFLVAVQDESCCLIRTVVIDHAAHLHFTFPAFYDLALVGYDAHRPAIDPGIAAKDALAVVFFELIEIRFVDDALNHIHHIIWLVVICREQSIDIFRIFCRCLGCNAIEAGVLRGSQLAHDLLYFIQGLLFRGKFIIRNAGDLGMGNGAAEGF